MDTFEIAGARIHLCADGKELTRSLAERFAVLAEQSVKDRGRFMVALSGGSTPASLYSLLAQAEYSQRLPWNQTQFFWGDERCVPHASNESNYKMANDALLSKINVSSMNIHPTVGQDENPQRCAENYQKTIQAVFDLKDGEVPAFDLILLGLGPEGHTASLFPGSPALGQTQALVMSVYVEKFNSHRITFTPRLLNQAADIIFMVEGAGKKDILPEVLEQPESKLPAQYIKPVHGILEWFTDKAAAVNLHLDRYAGV